MADITPQQIMEQARTWLGTKYHHQGRLKKKRGQNRETTGNGEGHSEISCQGESAPKGQRKGLSFTTPNIDNGWRIPAKELEKIINQEIISLLKDTGQMMELLAWNEAAQNQPFDCPPPKVESPAPELADMTPKSIDENTLTLIERADLMASEWQAMSAVIRRSVLARVIQKIELHPSRLRLVIRLEGLRAALKDEQPLQQTKADRGDRLVTIERPVSLKKRGLEMRLVIGNKQARQPDKSLIELITRAHAYLHDLTTIPDISLNQIAQRHSVPASEVSRHLPLAFLSPELTKDILKGEQRHDITAHSLGRMAALGLDWDDQKSALRG